MTEADKPREQPKVTQLISRWKKKNPGFQIRWALRAFPAVYNLPNLVMQ